MDAVDASVRADGASCDQSGDDEEHLGVGRAVFVLCVCAALLFAADNLLHCPVLALAYAISAAHARLHANAGNSGAHASTFRSRDAVAVATVEVAPDQVWSEAGKGAEGKAKDSTCTTRDRFEGGAKASASASDVDGI